MTNFLLTISNDLLLIYLVLFTIGLNIFFFFVYRRHAVRQSKKLKQSYLELKEEIRYSIAPNFVELSVDAINLVDLAIEVWRIEQRIIKLASNIPEQQLKGIENSIQKFKRYCQSLTILNHYLVFLM